MKFLLFLFFSFPLFALVGHKVHWDGADYHFNSQQQFEFAKYVVEKIPLKGDEKILDIGCGDDKVTAMIQKKLSSGTVLGVDISPSMVSCAKELFPHIFFEVKDVCKLDYQNRFDYALSFSTMQWVVDQKMALSEIHLALKERGRLVIDMPQGLPDKLQQAVDETQAKLRWKPLFESFKPNWRFYEVEEYAFSA